MYDNDDQYTKFVLKYHNINQPISGVLGALICVGNLRCINSLCARLQYIHLKIESTVKYVNEMGLKCPNGSLFECNQKVLKGFFELWASTCFSLFIQLRIFSFSLPPMWTYIFLLLSPLVCSPNKIQLKKRTQRFFKII